MPAVMRLGRRAQLMESDLTAELARLSFSMPLPLQATIVVVVPHCLAVMLLLWGSLK
jgi:hypothetical protein